MVRGSCINATLINHVEIVNSCHGINKIYMWQRALNSVHCEIEKRMRKALSIALPDNLGEMFLRC